MKCAGFEPLLALYVGGDLPPDEARRVEAHLAECADCRAARGVLESTQAGLRSLAEETLDGVVYARIRAAVLGELRREQRPAWRVWMLAVAAAVLVGLATLTLWRRVTPVPAPPKILTLAPVIPDPPPLPKVVLVERPARRRAKPVAPRPVETESFVVKLVTNDPDVVIYWIVGTNGDAL